MRGVYIIPSRTAYMIRVAVIVPIHTVNLERRTRLCYKYINIARQYDSNRLLYNILTLKSGGTPRLSTL